MALTVASARAIAREALDAEREALRARLLAIGGTRSEQALVAQYLDLVDRRLSALTAAETSEDTGGVHVGLNVNLSLADIEKFVLAAQDTNNTGGWITGSVVQQAVVVPAASGGVAGTGSIVFDVLPGTVASVFGEPVLATNDVGAGVEVDITVDGKPGVGTQGYVLGPTQSLPIAQYLVAKSSGIEVALTNPSVDDVTVWFYGVTVYVQLRYWQAFFEPVVKLPLQKLYQAIGYGGGS